jgi:hypothetical protein
MYKYPKVGIYIYASKAHLADLIIIVVIVIIYAHFFRAFESTATSTAVLMDIIVCVFVCYPVDKNMVSENEIQVWKRVHDR